MSLPSTWMVLIGCLAVAALVVSIVGFSTDSSSGVNTQDLVRTLDNAEVVAKVNELQDLNSVGQQTNKTLFVSFLTQQSHSSAV